MPASSSNSNKRHKALHNSRSPYSQPLYNTYDTTSFPLTPTRFPVGTPTQSKRSKKIYSNLDDDRQLLLHLREIWVKKLEVLKEDNKFLQRMKNTKEEDLKGIQPLFAPDEGKAKERDSSATSPLESVLGTPHYIETPQYSTTTSEHMSAIGQVEDLYHPLPNNLEDNEEEQARKALDLMLKEFGDAL